MEIYTRLFMKDCDRPFTLLEADLRIGHLNLNKTDSVSMVRVCKTYGNRPVD